MFYENGKNDTLSIPWSVCTFFNQVKQIIEWSEFKLISFCEETEYIYHQTLLSQPLRSDTCSKQHNDNAHYLLYIVSHGNFLREYSVVSTVDMEGINQIGSTTFIRSAPLCSCSTTLIHYFPLHRPPGFRPKFGFPYLLIVLYTCNSAKVRSACW